MSPFKSIKGRALGKLLEGYKSSDIGKGFGSGGGGGPSGLGPVAVPSSLATGGTVELIGTLVRHTFTSPGTFLTGDNHPGTVEYLIIAGGGGGGGAHHGGGGGACWSGGSAGGGGTGGGGPGGTFNNVPANSLPNGSGVHGTANTGGGGGGGAGPDPAKGGDGGSGIVVIRYQAST